MYAKVKIGEVEVPMLWMASADILYRNIFHEDAIKLQTQGDIDPADRISFVMKMGFVMAKAAEIHDRKELRKLNEDDFLEWMDQFDRTSFYNALEDILKTYEGQMVTSSDAKKNND